MNASTPAQQPQKQQQPGGPVPRCQTVFARGWASSTSGVRAGYVLNDCHRVVVLNRMYETIGQKRKIKMPAHKVDVLDADSLRRITQNTNQFRVTKKLDGKRCVLFGWVCWFESSMQLQLYSVDGNCTVRMLGMEPVLCAQARSFVVDTEFLNGQYYVFATLVAQGRQCGLCTLGEQLLAASLVLQQFPFLQTFVHVKEFYESTQGEYAWRESYKHLADDGLIFTCTTTPESFKWKPREMQTVDFVLRDETKLCIDDVQVAELTPQLTPEQRAQTRYFTPCIVECKPSDSKTRRGEVDWSFHRVRPDKDRSNFMHTFLRNSELFLRPILLKDLPSPGMTGPAAARTQSYWAGTQTLQQRQQHPLKNMRNFHNICKDELYMIAFDLLGVHHYKHLELGYGRGGDTARLHRHLPAEIRSVIAVDSDGRALDEAERRWGACRVQTRGDKPDLTTIQCDLSSNSEVDEMVATEIKGRVSSIFAHFAAHYFAQNFEFLCEELLEYGGVAGVTMFDRRRVQQMLDATPDGRRIFQIKGQDMVEVKYAGSRDRVSVWVHSIGKDHQETLYDPEDMLSPRRYKIEDSFHFDSIKPTRKYGPGSEDSEMWEFTSLYQAVLYKKIRLPETASSSPQHAASPGYAPSSPRYTASPGYAASSPGYAASPSFIPYSPTNTNTGRAEEYDPDAPGFVRE